MGHLNRALIIFLLIGGCDRRVVAPVPDALRESFDAYQEPVEASNLKSEWGERYSHVWRALDTASEWDAAIDVLAGRSKQPAYWAEGNYAGTLECVLIARLIDADDDPRLTRMLSLIPTEVDGPNGFYIEVALVEPYTGRGIDGLKPLFGAYEQAENAAAKNNAMRAIRRAFHDQLTAWTTDAEALEIVKHWWEHQRGYHKVNPARVDTYGSCFSASNVIDPPLFISQYGPERIERRIIDP